MKNKITILGVVCLILISFALSVYADETTVAPAEEIQQTAPDMSQGQVPQGERPQGEMPRGEIPENTGERPARDGMEQPVTAQTEAPEAAENTEQMTESEATSQESTDEQAQPSQDAFEFDNMQNPNPFEGIQTTETEKPYEKWITPIISAISLIFGFVFVILYKRKRQP